MEQKTLVATLKHCKEEVLALKTAHERGLGVAEFFSETGSVSYMPEAANVAGVSVEVKFSDEQTEAPYCQCYFGRNLAVNHSGPEATWDEDAHTLTFTYEALVGGVPLNASIKVISSAPIEELTVSHWGEVV